MGSSIRFTRPCSTCGRNLEIPIVHLGREVACSHCGARFVASMTDVSTNRRDSQNLEDRIDRLLAVTTTSSKRFFSLKTDNRESSASTTYEV